MVKSFSQNTHQLIPVSSASEETILHPDVFPFVHNRSRERRSPYLLQGQKTAAGERTSAAVFCGVRA